MLLTVAAFILSIYVYGAMPILIASHWGTNGQVNGYLNKNIALFISPVILLITSIMFVAIPKIDPLKANFDLFKEYYYGLVVIISLFLFAMHLHTIAWNLGIKVNPNTIMPIALGVLFFYIGMMLKHTKPNWFVGIRTPWTISNNTVWEKTHKLGATLFKLSGIISIIGVLASNLAIYFAIVPILISTVVLIAYSYVEYKKIS